MLDSAPSLFSLHGCIEMHGQQNIKCMCLYVIFISVVKLNSEIRFMFQLSHEDRNFSQCSIILSKNSFVLEF